MSGLTPGRPVSGTDEEFRTEIREWLAEHLTGDNSRLIGVGGPGSEHELVTERLAWERELGAGGWVGIGWPVQSGGRGATASQQVIFHEEYARANAPGRLNHMAEKLVGPTLLAYGTPEQQERFLPGILSGETLWCQGYSEPGAGSDLAGVQTRARREGDRYRITGQKIWTSLAHLAHWCFLVARTDPESKRHKGLSYLLVPMQQPGVDVRPIRQLTGTSEFNEVFFDDAEASVKDRVGEEGDGWRVAMGTLGFERGVATLGQQIGFARELEEVIDTARSTRRIEDSRLRERLLDAWVGLQVMRATAVGELSRDQAPGLEASVSKLQWSGWHRDLGELAVDVQGESALLAEQGAPPDASPDTEQEDHDVRLTDAQRLFLFTRADTIYGGSDEIQRNILAERLLGLPREPR
ncbi:acyl-CoA dehydrogenase [Enemella dayhoffiae]|uniref:Acyl-CoA dehydrogenase n=1 Tax=Enemella dayhoffiae TaxID=2016507 RepID=A0A255GL24_9ACTN|nr:acyl-CoA dehydrogenase family protein [Enemella dayhoffiae]OYO16538.1 acyl-CoA dehydrogenase [Enemella dayhoffiae]